MKNYFTLFGILGIFLLSACEESQGDFRLELIGEYSLHRSCVQETGGQVIWEEESDLTATISIPTDSAPFDGLNPPDYVKPEDRALQIDLFPEGSSTVTYYLWVNPSGDIKEAIFDPNHIITGKALPSSFEMHICDCALGSQINCVFD
ncbi:MAG: hypothetical protein AAF502_00400 [Bacteroidota bacterium]